jgi:hypothetical protein
MKHFILAAGTYTLFAILLFFPLFTHPFSHISNDYDSVFITWTMSWVAKNFTHPQQLFNAPIFYPYTATLTFSDPFLTGALIAAPFLAVTGEPVVAYSVNFFLALIGTAFFFYLFMYELTRNKVASFLVGLGISFGVTHLHYVGHLHMLMIQFIPLGLWAWLKFTQTYKKRFLLLCISAFLAQSLNSPFSTYLFLTTLSLFAFDPATHTTIRNKWKMLLAGLLFSFGALLLFYFPYLQSAQFYNSYRSIREAAHFSLSVDELFSPLRTSLIFLFFIAVLIAKRWREKIKVTPLMKGCVLLFSIGIIFSLGPVLKWQGQTVKIPFPIPLPYSVAHYVLPGFKAFRTPSRWLILSHLAAFVLMGALLRQKKKNALLIPLFLIIVAFEAQPYRYFSVVPTTKEYPAAYTWLAQHQATTVAHLPTYTYDKPNAKQETYRMLQSSTAPHTYQLYNGYSGFTPQERLDEMNLLHDRPLSVEAGELLMERNIEWAVIHTSELKPSDQPLLYELRKESFYNDFEYVIVPPAHIKKAQCW